MVNGIQAGSRFTVIGSANTFTAIVDPAPGEILQYSWSATAGVLEQTAGISVTWQAPENPVVATITVQVTNQDMLSTVVSAGALVKDTSLASQAPLIWYPFDSDNKNAAADRFHATATGVSKTEDARGMSSLAYRFTSGQNIIYTENHDDLNFSGPVSLSCWVRCEQFGSERFIISHGSWQQRYKLSITPEGRLRWTVKTSTGVSDLDCSSPIDLNRYYHVTALYTGYSMELYLDGELDTFKAFSGTVLSSTKPFTIGRMDNLETQYALLGSVDEVKLWDKEIPVSQVGKLKNQWATPFGIDENELLANVYPNPSDGMIYITFNATVKAEQVSLHSSDGRKLADYKPEYQSSPVKIQIPRASPGIYLLKVIMNNGSIISRKIILK